MDALPALSALASVGSGITGMVQSNTNRSILRTMQKAAVDDSLRESVRLMGAQRAAYAKSGVDVTSGTPLDVLADSAAEADLDALRTAYGYQVARQQEKAQGVTALTAGLAKGADTLLTAWGKRSIANPDVGTTYRRPQPGDLIRPKNYRLPTSGWPTLPGRR